MSRCVPCMTTNCQVASVLALSGASSPIDKPEYMCHNITCRFRVRPVDAPPPAGELGLRHVSLRGMRENRQEFESKYRYASAQGPLLPRLACHCPWESGRGPAGRLCLPCRGHAGAWRQAPRDDGLPPEYVAHRTDSQCSDCTPSSRVGWGMVCEAAKVNRRAGWL
jgi:hypothetical protein